MYQFSTILRRNRKSCFKVSNYVIFSKTEYFACYTTQSSVGRRKRNFGVVVAASDYYSSKVWNFLFLFFILCVIKIKLFCVPLTDDGITTAYYFCINGVNCTYVYHSTFQRVNYLFLYLYCFFFQDYFSYRKAATQEDALKSPMMWFYSRQNTLLYNASSAGRRRRIKWKIKTFVPFLHSTADVIILLCIKLWNFYTFHICNYHAVKARTNDNSPMLYNKRYEKI